MSTPFIVKKVLNNNVLIADHLDFHEVVLIGRGIGFSRSKGDQIEEHSYEKMFVLKNEKEQEQYKMLLPYIDEEVIAVIHEVIQHIEARLDQPLNEHIHIGLTDHISFALKRIKQGMDLKNPFIVETKTLYPLEYELAKEAVDIIQKRLSVSLPDSEVGFIVLHIHGAITDKPLSEVNQSSQLIAVLTGIIEDSLKIKIDRDSINYLRLVRHIRFTIDRVQAGEKLEEPEKMADLLKNEYPLCYNTAWKLVKVMQQTLKKPVYNAEAVYLTMHLYRLSNKIS
ncbi:transcription antiterminator [Bacillus sp. FJAT-42376]|uniref:glucose PTS transporter transcription antiterminator GlcT n=1 Tax=Bacillus sp. FJAT-42376 TaxID=2014076 RepID=UPI000F4D54C5|nr:transcription antiterminator [Bacillus sp. FJAT-42376]AZB42592.1 transcription antiterminator [Bacillus sp. FJAT-42376]